MDNGVAEEIGEFANHALEGVTHSGNNWAAIILLVGLLGFLLIVLMFGRAEMKARGDRFAAREKQNRADEQERIAEIKADFETQLERERITQDFVARMNDRYDATLNRVTEAFGENSAVLRQAKDEIRRNSESLDRNTQLLEKFVPRLPKANGARKVVVKNE